MAQKSKISLVLLFLMFGIGLKTVSAESGCKKKGLITNGVGGHTFGAIFDPPKNSNYSAWEPIVPQAIAIDSKDNIYIGDSVNYRVVKFDRAGHFIFEFSLQPPSIQKKTELSHVIQDMAIDKDDNLYVVNLLEFRVEKYSTEGRFFNTLITTRTH